MTAAATSADVTEDAFLGGRLAVRQPRSGYRVRSGDRLLAAALRAAPGDKVIDAGAGVGVVGLAAARRIAGIEVLLVEQDDGLADLARGNIARNGLEQCYIRPMVLRGYGAPGMSGVGSPIEVFICAWPWGPYLGEGALERGVDVCVSSWHRPAPNTFPSAAKGAGHYNNAQLIKFEAMANGYVEAIALGPDGLVSEGSGQNLFLVRDGALITPPLDGTNLTGITRDAVLRIAADLGIAAREQPVPRESLYTADELFFTGTASEVTPIRSVDRIPIGGGRAGPLTLRLQQHFLALATGRLPDAHGWLTPVPALAMASAD